MDGAVNQGEFGWEYGYISNFTGNDGSFYGWHPNPFYWQQPTDISIYWPQGYTPPAEAWGIGGDSTGCRPPMSWKDGGYPWAQALNDQWAAVRRWQSSYTGIIRISGSVGRYYDSLQGWDVVFSVAINAEDLTAPVLYSIPIPWNDYTLHTYVLPSVSVQQGDHITFLINAAGALAHNSYIRYTATIEEATLVRVPNVTQQSLVNAEKTLIGSGLLLGGVQYDFDPLTPVEHVSSQNPNAGAQIGQGAAVDVTISLGSELEAVDIDDDGGVGLSDLAVFSGYWMHADCDSLLWCAGADVNRDGYVDADDLLVVAAQWVQVRDI